MSMEWKPASVADSRMSSGEHGGTALNRSTVAYTFGHGITPGNAKDPALDDRAAVWWAKAAHPTTNDARNSDLQAFWGSQDLGKAVADITGQRVRHAVKEAGRGSHIKLRQSEEDWANGSLYKETFCRSAIPAPGSPTGTTTVAAVASEQYFAAKQQHRANKALGTGSSVNLSFMW